MVKIEKKPRQQGKVAGGASVSVTQRANATVGGRGCQERREEVPQGGKQTPPSGNVTGRKVPLDGGLTRDRV